ncbi:MAG: type IV fimbrial biogenesis protein FimT [Pseudohongiellaceae bacterium]|jgi:type IV fimbrial biogenesis protein FimT
MNSLRFIHRSVENRRIDGGFSLIELLVVMAILSILLAVSLPNFRDMIESNSTNSQAKLFLTTLNLARSEAIKRGGNVAICASDDGADCDENSWEEGWIVFFDANGDANGVTGSIDANDILIRVFDSVGSTNVTTFTVDLFEYNSLGFSATGGTQTLLICPASENAANARSIVIGPSGRGRRVEDGLGC